MKRGLNHPGISYSIFTMSFLLLSYPVCIIDVVFYQRVMGIQLFFVSSKYYYVLRLVAVILLYKLRETEFKGSSQFENVRFMILERSRS